MLGYKRSPVSGTWLENEYKFQFQVATILLFVTVEKLRMLQK